MGPSKLTGGRSARVAPISYLLEGSDSEAAAARLRVSGMDEHRAVPVVNQVRTYL